MGTRDDQSSSEAAIEWFVRLRETNTSAETRRRFEAWLAADPAHPVAWRELERMWGGLDHLADVAHPRPAQPSRPNVVPLKPNRPGPSGRSWRASGIAAALVFAAWIGWQALPVGLFADYRAGTGERRLVRLDDGSQVELATESALDVDFTGERRSVTLVAGEAFFTVAKDPRRPFVVSAGPGQITVRGTAFNVRLAGGAMVAVAENAVEVSAAKDAGIRVGVGEMVRFGSHGVSDVAPADLDTIAAWRSDQIVFRNAPLSQVVAELQRYRRGHIQIIGGGIGEKRVTAVFDTRRVDAALDTIARSLGLHVLTVPGVLTAILPG